MSMGETAGQADDTKHEYDKTVTLRGAICNCMAFFAINFIVVGELMNEHNLWAAVVIGGGLSILNVMVASAHLDQLRRVRQLEQGAMEKRMKKVKTRRKERKEEKLRDAIAIDIDSLIDETSEKTSKVSCKSKECEIDKGVSSKKKPHKSGTQKKKEVLDNDEEVDKDGKGGSARKGRRQKRCKNGEKQCKRNKKRKQEKKAQHKKKGIGVAEEAVVLQM